MPSRIDTKTKKSSDKSSFSSVESQTSAFEPRPFVTQAKTVNNTDKSDLKTSLRRAEKYGHNPNQIQSADISSKATPMQPKMEVEGRTNQSPIQCGKAVSKASGGHLKGSRKPPFIRKKSLPEVPGPQLAGSQADWSNLVSGFNPGDLIYGLNQPRREAFDAVNNANKNQGKAIIIDQLNEQFLGSNNVGPQNREVGKVVLEQEPQGGQMTNDFEKTAGYRQTQSPQMTDEARDYKTWLDKHPRYSPVNREVRGKPLSSAFRQSDRIKKSSKAGLEYTTKEKQKNVHFVLDNINQEDVVHKRERNHNTNDIIEKIHPKTGDSQQSVTASELRKLYRGRNEQEIMQNVNFYQGGKVVDSPWMSNPELWSQYKPKSEQ